MTEIDWYFDVISPFAYLQFPRLDEVPAGIQVNYRPVLFAGLLNHWGQLGPAEIEAKKVFTYQSCHWQARKLGLPFRLPSAHPFNPLRALRLAIAMGATREAAGAMLDLVWKDGLRPDDDADWSAMKETLGIEDADQRIADPEVKETLRKNGEKALAAGVFGVPTSIAGGRLFWGVDSTDFLLDYLADPALFDEPEMARLETLPEAASRT